MIESLGNPRGSPLPPRDRQDNHSKSLKRTGRFEFRRQGEAYPEERTMKPPSRETQDYEENWEHEFLNSLAKEWCEKKANPRNLIINPDDLNPSRPREPRTRNMERKSSKSKRREFEKYKAYAVRMKIPSFNELGKFKTKEEKRSTATIASKATSSYHIKQIEESLHPKLEELMKNCVREGGPMVTDSLNANISAHINANIFKKRSMKSQNREKKATIRKRSIKNSEKRKEEALDFVRSNNQGLKTSMSPRGIKKLKVSLEDSCSPYCEKRYCNDPNHQDSKNASDVNRSTLKGELKTPEHAAVKEKAASPTKRTYLKVSPAKEHNLPATNYLEKGINFKRKSKLEDEDRSPLRNEQSRQTKQKTQEKQLKLQSKNSQCNESPSKMIMKTIYTSKDVIRQKNKIPAGSKAEQRETKDVRSQKVFSFNSEDKYIRRILMDNDWIINPDQRSKFYHLKWVFKPCSQDYNELRPGQFINHIKNSHELTSKNYLNKNLKKSLAQWPSLYNHYPKCYDLAKDAEKQQFFEEFVKQFMMILLQNIYKYLLEQRADVVKPYEEFYSRLIGEMGQYEGEKKKASFLRVKKFRKIDMEAYKSYDSSCLIHMNLIIVALRYWRHLRKQQEMQSSEDGYHFLKFGQKEFEQHLNFLQMYSKMVTPSFIDNDERYFEKEFYSTPSNITIERIVKEYVYFQHQLGAQWEVSSQRNLWIIKPCSASRGNGIYLDDNCKEILFNSKGIQSKIVQKYIERPLIFRDMKYGKLSNKKFDIRQWVLLRSVDPLQIYMFSHCYVRICSEEYNIFNINNLKSHLTNYSFNKHYYKNTSQSVMDYQTFLNLVKDEFNVDYQQDIRPKIEEIVIRSIKSSQDLLDDFSKRCFSLLGYDILLDQQCNPWLLEVNMSPACEERTQWLKEYLKEMGKGLLKIILPQNYLKPAQIDTNSQTKLSEAAQAGHLKKIKTQMSQQNFTRQEQIKSNILIRYVDSIFADKYEQIYDKVQENREEDEGFVLEPTEEDVVQDNTNDDEEVQITYEAFLNDHPEDSDEQPEGQTERMLVPSYPKPQKQEKNRPQLQIAMKEEDEDRPSQQNQVNFENIIDWDQSNVNTHNNRCDSNVSSQFGIFQISQGKNYQERKPFKWHLICFQEYHHTKKEKDLLIDVVGIRLHPQKLKFTDQKIDQYEQGQLYVEESIRLIQNRIRSFLLIKKMRQQQKKQEDKQSLRVNFSRLARNNSERESKSALMQYEQKSIWHYSYLHTYQDNVYQKIQVERPQTSRLKQNIQGMVKIKSSSDTKFREKIKSLVSNAGTQRMIEDSDQSSKIEQKGRVRLQRQSHRQIEQHKQSEQMESNNIENMRTERSDEEEPQQIIQPAEDTPVDNLQTN